MDKTTKILIAGGTGVIGSALATFFRNKNYEVSLLSRGNKYQSSSTFHWNPSTMQVDLTAFSDQEIIINLAGAGIADKYWTKKRKIEILESRVNATRTVVKGIKESGCKPKLIIQASAIGIYGDRPNEILIENSEKGTGFLSDVCSRWENEAVAFSKLDIPLAIVRIGIVLSNKGGYMPKIQKASKLRINLVFGSGEQFVSWIHIDDLVHAFNHIIQKEISGVFNAVAPDPVTSYEMQKAIARVSGIKSMDIKTNRGIVKFMLGSFSELFLSSQFVIPKRLTGSGFIFKNSDLHGVLTNLL